MPSSWATIWGDREQAPGAKYSFTEMSFRLTCCGGNPSARAIQEIPDNHQILHNVVSTELPMALRIRHNKVSDPPACPLSTCMRLLRGAWAPNVIWYLSATPR